MSDQVRDFPANEAGIVTEKPGRPLFGLATTSPEVGDVRLSAWQIFRGILSELGVGVASALFRFVADRIIFPDGDLFMKVRGRLYTWVYGWGHGVAVARFVTLRNPWSIQIGRYSHIYRHAILEGPIKTGEHCWIGERDYIYPHTELADRVALAPNVTIITQWHPIGPPGQRTALLVRRPVRIGRGCTVNTGSIILAGCTIGEGCVVMSGSRVTRSLPPHSVVAGDPARIVRRLGS